MNKAGGIKEVLISLLKCALYFGLWYGISTIVTSVVTSAITVSNPASTPGAILEKFMPYATGVSALSGILFVILCSFLYRSKGYTLFERTRIKPVKASLIYHSILFGASFVFVINLMLFALEYVLPASWYTSFEDNSVFGMGNQMIEMLSVCVVAPIYEEILFRGLIAKKLQSIMPSWFALILSSLLFGALHNGMIGFIYATICGGIMCLIYFKTGSLVPGILFHVAFNTTSTLVSGTTIPIFVFVLTTIVTIAELIYLFITYRGFKK
ncbi:MAG: CPBP family intramembrane metalloprotease [Clostridia bacterium]|nr:CPBP family intramembrane metalloprotease [Clostridia bacterium]